MAPNDLLDLDSIDADDVDYNLDDSAVIPIDAPSDSGELTSAALPHPALGGPAIEPANDSSADFFAIRPSRALSQEELARLADEVDGLIESRAFVDAMDLLVARAGVTRRRAHGLVTALAAQPDVDLMDLLAHDEAPTDGPSPPLMSEIHELMDAGKKMEAITHYSERMDVSLKEAKAFIEALDDVTDFECEVAHRQMLTPIVAVLGLVVVVIVGGVAAMWATVL